MAVATAVFAGLSLVSGVLQSKEQRKQTRLQNRIQAVARRREVRRTIATRRIRTAEIQSSGLQLGVGGGTAVQGAVSGVVGDTASVIGAANQQFTGQQAVAASAERASVFQQFQQGFGSLTSIAGQFVGGTGSVGAQNRAAFTSLFD